MLMQWILATLLTLSPGADELPPPPEDVLQLSEEIVARIDERVGRRSHLMDRRLDLLADFMFSSDGLDFEYIVEPTRNPVGTYEARRGNCLSFTLLFLAMADHLGLWAEPREVQVPISWRRDGSALYESGHVNVHVRTETRRAVVDFEPDPFLSRRLSVTRRGHRISRERVLAHYYNNRAAELMGEGKPEIARLWSDQALAQDGRFSAALNNRGVIETRLGETEQALYFYQRALEVDSDNASTLFNKYELYRRTGQQERADEVLDKLERLRSRDPYLHWSLARNFENVGELDRAGRLYRRAIRMKDDEPLFYTGLARVADAQGDRERAEAALTKAIELARARPDRGIRWDDKLLALKLQLPDD